MNPYLAQLHMEAASRQLYDAVEELRLAQGELTAVGEGEAAYAVGVVVDGLLMARTRLDRLLRRPITASSEAKGDGK